VDVVEKRQEEEEEEEEDEEGEPMNLQQVEGRPRTWRVKARDEAAAALLIVSLDASVNRPSLRRRGSFFDEIPKS
jgi:hypothetical protein